MEPDKLHSIAQMVWEAMSQMSWREKKLDELEREVQQVVSQVGHQVMQDFLVPARVQQIQQQVEAGQIRCAGCGSPWQRHKREEVIHPKTIFGQKMEVSRDQYYCPRCDDYVMVADQELGLIGPRMTPRLAVVVALCGASWGYEVASAFLEFVLGVTVPAKTVQRVTTHQRLKPEPLECDRLDRPPGVVTMDGVLIRGREKDERLEMKVGSFFSHLVPVSKDRQEVMDASFVAGAMAAWQDFVEPVRQEARRRGLSLHDPVEFVSDGASGIWELQPWVFPAARPRLDQYHTKCKIGDRRQHAFGGRKLSQPHQQKVQDYVEQGLIDEALHYLQTHRPRGRSQKQAADKLIGYLQRHRCRLPNYQQVKAEGGTISSGLMEKANDLIVVRRLKDGIMHWTRPGADPVIQHRTHFINKHARTRTGPYDLAFCHQ